MHQSQSLQALRPLNDNAKMICSQVKGLDIPLHDPYPQRKPVITDTSLEDANRIIFSPWDAISGYAEPVTDNVIDIPGNIAGIESIPDGGGNRKNKETTRLPLRLEQIANKLNISTEEEKSNKSSSFSQLVLRVQSVHFRKVSDLIICRLLKMFISIRLTCNILYVSSGQI